MELNFGGKKALATLLCCVQLVLGANSKQLDLSDNKLHIDSLVPSKILFQLTGIKNLVSLNSEDRVPIPRTPLYNALMGHSMVSYVADNNVYMRVITVDSFATTGGIAVVTTEIFDPNQTCHPCAAAFGIAEYVRENSGWKLNRFEPHVDDVGTLGEIITHPKVLQIGKNRLAVAIEDCSTYQGYELGELKLFSWSRGKYWKLLRKCVITENDSGACDQDKESENHTACWGYASTFTFEQGPDTAYYNLVVKTKGSRCEPGFKTPKDFSDTVYYHFNGKEYTNAR
jgi:hypothetical protein